MSKVDLEAWKLFLASALAFVAPHSGEHLPPRVGNLMEFHGSLPPTLCSSLKCCSTDSPYFGYSGYASAFNT